MVVKPEAELKVSFGYQCNGATVGSYDGSRDYACISGLGLQRTSSFTCLSGAALSANATLADTNICHGLIKEEILPSWDSPNSFRKISSSPALSRLDVLSSSLQSTASNLSCSPSYQSDSFENDSFLKPMSAPSIYEGFLNAMEVQVAGGAAGEDRVQAICSEEHGWLFCAIYDGFNGRDAADFLAGTLYDCIIQQFNSIGLESKQEDIEAHDNLVVDSSLKCTLEDNANSIQGLSIPQKSGKFNWPNSLDSFQQGVVDSLLCALSQAENEFLYMVEQEMDDRPDLVSVGSCVLVVLLHGNDLYTLNLGDSRAVLASYGDYNYINSERSLKAIQLSGNHTVDNEVERNRLMSEHPDDPMPIVMGKVKGKLKVTRALGVGYLKKKNLNDALMGILCVRDLKSPPYISTEPSINVHKISKDDHFVVVASDGLFDFFTNDEVVNLVHSYILDNPCADPAKFLLEELMARAANRAGFSMEELMNIPAGRRRKYHDDVTVIVIVLGTNQRTSKASTWV